MPSIRPFKGVVYNKKKIKNMSEVVAPPYDIIPPRMQDELYKKHKNNVVRLIFGKINKPDDKNNNRYTRAAKDFKSWLDGHILIQDSDPAVYIYSQIYKCDGRKIERMGFISLMELDLDNKKVLPHEKTLKAPKEDRLQLLRSVKANLSPIFMLYEDDLHRVNKILKNFSRKTSPFIDVSISGVRHIIWKLSDRKLIKAIEGIMAKKDIFIADGHHRYETSINYAREVASGDASQTLKENSKFFMGYFVELEERSLTILPTHRLINDIGSLGREDIVHRLKKYFKVEKFSSAGRMLARMKALRAYHVFGVYLGKAEYYVIKLKSPETAWSLMGKGSKDWKSLDVSILHLFILQYILGIRDEDDNIEFVKDASEAFKAIGAGKNAAAFILNPTKVTQVKNVARHGEKMPRKATYFYPKPLSGLVINKF